MDYDPQNIPGWIQAIGALFSAGAAIATGMFTYRLTKVSKKQVEILEHQTKIQETLADKKPELILYVTQKPHHPNPKNKVFSIFNIGTGDIMILFIIVNKEAKRPFLGNNTAGSISPNQCISVESHGEFNGENHIEIFLPDNSNFSMTIKEKDLELPINISFDD